MKTNLSLCFFLFCLIIPVIGSGQLIKVTGSIINDKTGKSLENVNIFESVSGIGTITNFNGFFSLMLKHGNADIVFSQSGFFDNEKKLSLKKDTTLTISLIPLNSLKFKTKETDHQKTAEKTDKEKK